MLITIVVVLQCRFVVFRNQLVGISSIGLLLPALHRVGLDVSFQLLPRRAHAGKSVRFEFRLFDLALRFVHPEIVDLVRRHAVFVELANSDIHRYRTQPPRYELDVMLNFFDPVLDIDYLSGKTQLRFDSSVVGIVKDDVGKFCSYARLAVNDF